MIHDVVMAINSIVLIYFIVLLGSYSIVTLLSWIQVRRYFRRLVHARLQRSVRSRLTPPISICAPAFNEEGVIVDSIRSMLGLRYPQHEVVLANDGSTDGTLEQLIAAFDMYRVDEPGHVRLETAPVRGVWRSRSHSNLVVVDKENGRRADALNAAINYARYPLVCCVDADSLLEPEALMTRRAAVRRAARQDGRRRRDHPRRQRLRGQPRARHPGRPAEAVAADVPDRRVPARVHRRRAPAGAWSTRC